MDGSAPEWVRGPVFQLVATRHVSPYRSHPFSSAHPHLSAILPSSAYLYMRISFEGSKELQFHHHAPQVVSERSELVRCSS